MECTGCRHIGQHAGVASEVDRSDPRLLCSTYSATEWSGLAFASVCLPQYDTFQKKLRLAQRFGGGLVSLRRQPPRDELDTVIGIRRYCIVVAETLFHRFSYYVGHGPMVDRP